MEMLKDRLYAQERVIGTWCNLGSPLSAELAGITGYDWVLLDQEHGPGDNITLLHQLHALGKYPTVPIVRIAWRDRILTKRALDLGAGGIMFPYIQNAEEAREAVAFMQYAPLGERGLAAGTRCAASEPFLENIGKTPCVPCSAWRRSNPAKPWKTPQPSPPCRGWMSCSSARSI